MMSTAIFNDGGLLSKTSVRPLSADLGEPADISFAKKSG